MQLVRPILVIAAAMIAVTAATGDESDYEEAYRLRAGREILPLEELLSRAGLGPETRILELEIELEHGRHVYEIEYLDGDGRIREVLIDADSGEVVPEEDD